MVRFADLCLFSFSLCGSGKFCYIKLLMFIQCMIVEKLMSMGEKTLGLKALSIILDYEFVKNLYA